MAHYKILVGCSVKQDNTVLRYYLKSLAALKTPRQAELRFGFINDGGDDNLQLLRSIDPAVVLPAEQRPADALYAIGVQTHHWNVSTFEHLARQKQRLLDYAVEAGYTHVFLVDSDLLLEPTTLISLWETKADIINGVFWTPWQNGATALPQCWLSHPYGMAGYGMEEHEFLRSLARRQVLRVAGGGACVLVDTAALKRGLRYHPRLSGLPQDGMWQGEDRTFAILAQRLHERQLADGWPDIYHAYHPENRTEAALAEAWEFLSAPRQLRANYGDMVNLVIDPLEDPPLAESLSTKPELRCFRGRLGGLPLAPEIESRIATMAPGDEALVDVYFPPWCELPPYRAQRKTLRLTLVDIKPYSYAPGVAEVAFSGVGL